MFHLSYPNFVWGLSFVDLLILASRLTVLNASYSTKQGTIWCFAQEYKRYQERRAKGSFPCFFLGPSLPRPAFGSSGPPNNFNAKGLAHLGKLQLPQGGLLPKNRHPKGVLKGSKV